MKTWQLLLISAIIIMIILFSTNVSLSLTNKEGYPAARSGPARTCPPEGCKGKGGDCFSGDSLIYLENGDTKKIEDAVLGDEILSYSLIGNKFVYSPIIAIPHEKNNILRKFVVIETSGDKKIKMTETHLIPIMKKSCNKFELMKSENAEIGDTLITKDGNETVTAVTSEQLEGVYTVVTLDEYIVVDKIVASPFPNLHVFGSQNFHVLGGIYYYLFRSLYKINPNLLKNNIYEKYNKYSNEFFIYGLEKLQKITSAQ
jgi:hypothetical protein